MAKPNMLFIFGDQHRYGPWLFDRGNDPLEMSNLAGEPEHRETQRQLEKMLARWMAETGDPFETGKRDPSNNMLQLGQEFANERWNRVPPTMKW